MTVTIGRRELLAALGGAAAVWPLAARAQDGQTHHIGVLNTNPRGSPVVTAVFDELRRSGLVEGRNLIVEGAGIGIPYPQFGNAARELAKKNIEALVVGGGAPTIRAVQSVLPAMSIVGVADDMVGDGLARSLAQPGGNVTGVSLFAPELDGKRQELLIELLPDARRMASLADPRVQPPKQLQALKEAARARGIELSIYPVANPEGIIPAMDAAKAAGAEGLNVLAASLFVAITRLSSIAPQRCGCPPCTCGPIIPRKALSSGTAPRRPRSIVKWRECSRRCCAAPSPRSCQWNSPPSSNWRSISIPPKHSA
jgi:putative tryptophan/tyrosine transport system substrate-binding protein